MGNRTDSIAGFSLFSFNQNVSFLVRDILPIQTLFYLIACYTVLVQHQANMKLIAADINQISLNWLVPFYSSCLLHCLAS